jgi:hypothetical protein
MTLLMPAYTLTARYRQIGLPSKILLGIRLYLERQISTVWLNTSVSCYICNFSIPGKHSLERSICLHQIVLWTVQKSMETSEMMEVDLIWFMAWNADEFLYNFMYRISWILQSIFLYLGGRLGVGELNTDFLLWSQTFRSLKKNYWLISLFLHLVTLIHL